MQFKYFLYLISLFLLPKTSFSQDLELYQGKVEYEKYTYPCLMIEMQADPKETKKNWDDYMKDQYDVKLKGIGFLTNKDVLTAERVMIPAISNRAMDFYTKIVEKKGVTRMQVFASFGYDYPLSPERYPTAFNALRDLTTQWLDQYLISEQKQRIKASQELIADLQDETSDLNKDIENNKKEIDKLSKEIERYRKEIAEKEHALRDAEQKLNDRKNYLRQLEQELKSIINR